jgi:hypothetical protein
MGTTIAHSSSIDAWVEVDCPGAGTCALGDSGCTPRWTPDSTPVLEEAGRSVSYDSSALLREMHNDARPYDRRV